jgi:2-polyprenyl-3-methyl-5-hydroxy-6-metoxy-1,4-benzoquinol methylase
LREYYSTYYGSIEGSATFDGSDRFARHLSRCLKITPKGALRILDFGGGVDATLSRSLAKRLLRNGAKHVEIALVDYNASCHREWGGITVECYQSLEAATDTTRAFDIVLASAIVEHIPYPRAVLLKLLNSLSAGGRAYFRTPAMSATIKLAARLGVHIDFTYPGHVHDMGQPFWDNVLKSLEAGPGFHLIRSRPSVVETEFRAHPSRTVIAHALKSPWYLLRRRYAFVGGWEAVIARGGN